MVCLKEVFLSENNYFKLLVELQSTSLQAARVLLELMFIHIDGQNQKRNLIIVSETGLRSSQFMKQQYATISLRNQELLVIQFQEFLLEIVSEGSKIQKTEGILSIVMKLLPESILSKLHSVESTKSLLKLLLYFLDLDLPYQNTAKLLTLWLRHNSYQVQEKSGLIGFQIIAKPEFSRKDDSEESRENVESSHSEDSSDSYTTSQDESTILAQTEKSDEKECGVGMFSSHIQENSCSEAVKQLVSNQNYSPSKRESLALVTDCSDMTDKINYKRNISEMPIQSFDSKITEISILQSAQQIRKINISQDQLLAAQKADLPLQIEFKSSPKKTNFGQLLSHTFNAARAVFTAKKKKSPRQLLLDLPGQRDTDKLALMESFRGEPSFRNRPSNNNMLIAGRLKQKQQHLLQAKLQQPTKNDFETQELTLPIIEKLLDKKGPFKSPHQLQLECKLLIALGCNHLTIQHNLLQNCTDMSQKMKLCSMNFKALTFDLLKLLYQEGFNVDLLQQIDVEQLRVFCLDQMEIENLDEQTTRNVLSMLPLVIQNMDEKDRGDKVVEIIKLLSFFAGVEVQSIRNEALKALLNGLFKTKNNNFSLENIEQMFDQRSILNIQSALAVVPHILKDLIEVESVQFLKNNETYIKLETQSLQEHIQLYIQLYQLLSDNKERNHNILVENETSDDEEKATLTALVQPVILILNQSLGGPQQNSAESKCDIKTAIKFMDFLSQIISLIGMDDVNNKTDVKELFELIATAIGKEVIPSSQHGNGLFQSSVKLIEVIHETEGHSLEQFDMARSLNINFIMWRAFFMNLECLPKLIQITPKQDLQRFFSILILFLDQKLNPSTPPSPMVSNFEQPTSKARHWRQNYHSQLVILSFTPILIRNVIIVHNSLFADKRRNSMKMVPPRIHSGFQKWRERWSQKQVWPQTTKHSKSPQNLFRGQAQLPIAGVIKPPSRMSLMSSPSESFINNSSALRKSTENDNMAEINLLLQAIMKKLQNLFKGTLDVLLYQKKASQRINQENPVIKDFDVKKHQAAEKESHLEERKMKQIKQTETSASRALQFSSSQKKAKYNSPERLPFTIETPPNIKVSLRKSSVQNSTAIEPEVSSRKTIHAMNNFKAQFKGPKKMKGDKQGDSSQKSTQHYKSPFARATSGGRTSPRASSASLKQKFTPGLSNKISIASMTKLPSPKNLKDAVESNVTKKTNLNTAVTLGLGLSSVNQRVFNKINSSYKVRLNSRPAQIKKPTNVSGTPVMESARMVHMTLASLKLNKNQNSQNSNLSIKQTNLPQQQAVLSPTPARTISSSSSFFKTARQSVSGSTSILSSAKQSKKPGLLERMNIFSQFQTHPFVSNELISYIRKLGIKCMDQTKTELDYLRFRIENIDSNLSKKRVEEFSHLHNLIASQSLSSMQDLLTTKIYSILSNCPVSQTSPKNYFQLSLLLHQIVNPQQAISILVYHSTPTCDLDFFNQNSDTISELLADSIFKQAQTQTTEDLIQTMFKLDILISQKEWLQCQIGSTTVDCIQSKMQKDNQLLAIEEEQAVELYEQFCDGKTSINKTENCILDAFVAFLRYKKSMEAQWIVSSDTLRECFEKGQKGKTSKFLFEAMKMIGVLNAKQIQKIDKKIPTNGNFVICKSILDQMK